MQDISVVERRRSSSGIRRSRSVRSSLRLIGARWRTSTVTAANNSTACRAVTVTAANNSTACRAVTASAANNGTACRAVTASAANNSTACRAVTASAANNSVTCCTGNLEVNLQPAVETLRLPFIPSAHQYLSLTQPQQEQNQQLEECQQQQKQRNSRMSWLAVFSNRNIKRVKSTSAVVGKQKDHKSKAAWILGFTYQKNKQGNSEPVCYELPEKGETEECHPSKALWISDVTEEEQQQTKRTGSQVLLEQHDEHWKASAERLSSPQRSYMRQKSNSLSRCSSPVRRFLQQQEFLPMTSSVGTKRRNSMWALGSSKSSMLRSI
jgi:hypothetical protein